MVKLRSSDHVLRAILSREAQQVPGQRTMQHAAVAGIFRERGDDLELLLIQRAKHEGDPWSGHMALPGGHVEPGETSKIAAQREVLEELGVELTKVARFLGALSQKIAHAHGKPIPLVVTPFLYLATEELVPVANEEVAEVVWIPLSYLCDPANRSSFKYKMRGMHVTLPCIDYEGHRIWGLTLRMLDELVERLRAIAPSPPDTP